jgi:zinc/manganese transport system substrate-binding protein
MKRFLFCLILLPALATATARADVNVFACEPEWAALATELGGGEVKIFSATGALQDPHHIEARPGLIARLRKADLLVCTGAELEAGWLPVLLRQAGNAKVQPGTPGFFEASTFVEMREQPAKLDRAEGDVHAAGNPHIQTSPRNIARVAAALAQRLAEIDPTHAAHYQKRMADFSRRWQEATARWERAAAPLQGRGVVSQHKSWVYLYEWLGMKEVAVLEPKPGVPPSSTHLAQLLAQLKAQPATMVIHAQYQDAQSAQWLSERAGLPRVALPFTVGANGKAKDLFGLFDDTIEKLTATVKP